jgi:hypothetical protein
VSLNHLKAGVYHCQMGWQRRLWTLRPTCLECTSVLSTVASCGLRTLKSLAVGRPCQADLTSSVVAVVPVGVWLGYGTTILVMFLTTEPSMFLCP